MKGTLNLSTGLPTFKGNIDVVSMVGSQSISRFEPIYFQILAEGDEPLTHEEVDEALSSPIAFVFDPAFDELAAFWLGWPRTLTYIPGSKKGTLRYEVEMMRKTESGE